MAGMRCRGVRRGAVLPSKGGGQMKHENRSRQHNATRRISLFYSWASSPPNFVTHLSGAPPDKQLTQWGVAPWTRTKSGPAGMAPRGPGPPRPRNCAVFVLLLTGSGLGAGAKDNPPLQCSTQGPIPLTVPLYSWLSLGKGKSSESHGQDDWRMGRLHSSWRRANSFKRSAERLLGACVALWHALSDAQTAMSRAIAARMQNGQASARQRMN